MTDESLAMLFEDNAIEARTKLRELVDKETLTDHQIEMICRYTSISFPDSVFVRDLFKFQNVTSHHIDLLLANPETVGVYYVFIFCKHFTPEQIKIGLTNEFQLTRDIAYSHPCCTDELRVWYHLRNT